VPFVTSPDDAKQRPHPRFADKLDGKTVTENFATHAEQRMDERRFEAVTRS
jgi:hypothetical protein